MASLRGVGGRVPAHALAAPALDGDGDLRAGGGRRLRDYELACVEALAGALSGEAREIVRRQLREVDAIQRFAGDRQTVVHLGPAAGAARFGDVRPEVRVARVTLRGAGGDGIHATIVVHRGLLSSIEFDRPPPDYAELLAASDGFAAGEWRFLGTGVRRLALTEGFIVAAERLDGELALCFREGSSKPEVVLLDEIDEDVRGTGSSFVKALDEVIPVRRDEMIDTDDVRGR